MKKSILLLGFSITALCGLGQADIAGVFGHQRTAGRFCGWAPGLGSIPGSLEVRNDFNFPITFHTNNSQRLYIDNTVGAVLGNVGIGGAFNSFFRPYSLLHIAQDNYMNTAGSVRNWMAPGPPSTYATTSGTGMLISNG